MLHISKNMHFKQNNLCIHFLSLSFLSNNIWQTSFHYSMSMNKYLLSCVKLVAWYSLGLCWDFESTYKIATTFPTWVLNYLRNKNHPASLMKLILDISASSWRLTGFLILNLRITQNVLPSPMAGQAGLALWRRIPANILFPRNRKKGLAKPAQFILPKLTN